MNILQAYKKLGMDLLSLYMQMVILLEQHLIEMVWDLQDIQ